MARAYRGTAARILSSLDAAYVGDVASTEGILLHSVGANPRWSPSSFNVSLVYAGYYALEAIARLRARTTSTVEPAAH